MIGEQSRLVTLAHQTAMFTRVDAKQIEPLDFYLKRIRNPGAIDDDQGEAVAAMFDRMINNQDVERT